MKGWKDLVHEAVTRIITEEVKKQVQERFPDVETGVASRRADPGFGYSVRQYIEEHYTRIMKTDPEIDQLIRTHLKEVLLRSFDDVARVEKKPEAPK